MRPSPDLSVLREFYGLLPQPPAEPFQFLVWEILSADALPARRDLAWQALRRIPALTPDALFRAPAKALLEALAFAGPHRDERMERLRAATGEFRRRRGELEAGALRAGGLIRAARSLRGFTELPQEILDRALLFAAGFEVLPIDDPAARVVARLEGTAIPVSDGAEGFTLRRHRFSRELTEQRRRARRSLAAWLPKDLQAYRDAVVYLRHHARHTCAAVGPHCGVCPLAATCEFRLRSPDSTADAT